MAGTSPAFNYHSPSFHSSSYLPKMEANYMKDYICCDIHLDSMHELLQHYEEAHAAPPANATDRSTPKDSFTTGRSSTMGPSRTIQQPGQIQQGTLSPQAQLQQHASPFQNSTSPLFSGQSQDQMGTFDNLDDMDMDDGTPAPQMQPAQGPHFQPQPQFGRQQPRGSSVNVNLANAFQGQGLNSVTPTTQNPQQAMNLPNNPTVSSVNTPSLTTPAHSQQTATPDPSQPSTPSELDPDLITQMNNLDYNQITQGNYDLTD
ncbi:hypothetical protein MRB53_040317 [Persea americana]|nr:hypothetical protein MRB53_040317 [Persea americana]